MEVITKHYLISGRVQGVGFRAFTHRTALSLGLKGWVRNLEDGRVEAVAQGDGDQLRRLEEALQKGPPLGRVDTLQIDSWSQASVSEFEVRKDGLKPCSEES